MKSTQHTVANKGKIKRILSIDPSSKALAFAVVEPGKLLNKGKISLPKDEWERIKVVTQVIPALIAQHKPDYMLVEKTVYLQNPMTTITLAYIVGAIMSQGARENVSTGHVAPLKWKPGVGYKNVSAKEKKEWALTMPEKEVKKKAAFERKERVRVLMVDQIPGLDETDYDIIDAIAIGVWGIKEFG